AVCGPVQPRAGARRTSGQDPPRLRVTLVRLEASGQVPPLHESAEPRATLDDPGPRNRAGRRATGGPPAWLTARRCATALRVSRPARAPARAPARPAARPASA